MTFLLVSFALAFHANFAIDPVKNGQNTLYFLTLTNYLWKNIYLVLLPNKIAVMVKFLNKDILLPVLFS